MLKNPITLDRILKRTSISLFLPDLAGGGAERVILHLAESFAQRGLTVDLVLVKSKSGGYLSQVHPNVRLIDLKSRFPKVLFKTLALRDYLRQEQPTVLLSTLDVVGAALWAQRLAGVPTRVVMCVQTHLSQQFQDKPGIILGMVRASLVRWFYPWADAIVTASEGVARDLVRMSGLPPDSIRVIYNPVVTPELLNKINEPIHHPWFAPGEPPVILGVGRLVRQKDFVTLIRAFALVRQYRPVRLMILGNISVQEPATKHQLEALVQELGLEGEVALPGFVENPYAYMAKAAVFVLSSIYEGFGNVVVEAMAAGTSVVSTDCESGPAEILQYGKYGRLVPVGDVDMLAFEIINALNDPTDPDLLQQRSMEFSVNKVADQYLEVINSLTKQRVA